MSKNQIIKLALLTLLVLLPLVFAQQQLFITADLPNITKDYTIDIKGTTIPGTQVEVLINDQLKRREPALKSDTFLFRDVLLDKEENTIKLIATDKQGTTTSVEKTVKVDIKPPEINLIIPEQVLESSVALQGRTSENVKINYWVAQEGDELTDDNKHTVEVQAGEFTLNLDLPFEDNKIKIIAKDEASHETIIEGKTKLDLEPPIINSNLDQFKYVEKTGILNTVFNPEIKIKGNTNEPAAITVYVNNKAQKIVKTDENNNFEVGVNLLREIAKDITKSSVSEEKFSAEFLGAAWTNQVKLVAVDHAGRESIQGPIDVVYALCGRGGPFRITPDTVTPNILNPRLILQGLQTAGFGFKIEYTGAHKADVKKVDLRPVMFRSKEGEKYDQDWVNPVIFFEKNQKRNGGEGYAQINIKKSDPEGDTDYAKEKAIAEYNKGKCATVPGFGCLKFYLQFTIEYTETYNTTTISRGEPERISPIVTSEVQYQKSCDRYELGIDQVRPENLIPKKHLKSSIDFLQKTSDAIENVQKPLSTVNTYLTYACAASTLARKVVDAVESWNCKWSNKLNIFGNKWEQGVAEVGLCDETYGQEQEKLSACQRCENTIKFRKEKYQNIINPVCDRIFGPAAPTLQKYIKDHQGAAKEVTLSPDTLSKPELQKWKLTNQGKIFSGNDCSFYTETGLPVVEDIYQKYKTGEAPLTTSDCREPLRPAHPACCGQQYMGEWGSACGIPSFGLDTFNEIKESACLAANKEGKNKVAGETCYQLWNSVAGFCDAEGGFLPQTIFTGVAYATPPAGAASNVIQAIIIPKGVSAAGLLQGAPERAVESYKIYLGYVANRYQIQPGQTNYYLNAETVLIPQKEVTDLFFNTNGELYSETQFAGQPSAGFKTAIEQLSAGQSIDNDAINFIYTKIRNTVGTVDKAYIVRPDSGLLRSMQCVYLPGVINWLKQWQGIVGHAKACLEKVMLTGDGSIGTCREFLSQYMCDFVWDSLSCTAQKYSQPSPGGGRIGGELGGVGDVFGAVSDSSLKTQNAMKERYGTTGLWKNLFNEKRLQNSVCAFAFTGTWDLDIEAISQMSIEAPQLPSQGLLSSCRRTFAGYMPTGDLKTKGLTTWIYRFATFLSAGSELRWWTELTCSDDYSCNPNDGYENGKCDCVGIGEKTIRVEPQVAISDRLSKGEIMDEPMQLIIRATNEEPSPKYRYDKATIHWESVDSNVPSDLRKGEAACKFNLVGGDAPSFCKFSLDKGSFWCSWGQQKDTITIDKRKTKADYPRMMDKLGVFAISDDLSFKIVGKQEREQPNANTAKYLLYKIENKAGRVVREIKFDDPVRESLRVDQEGDFEQTITISDKLTQEDFGIKEEDFIKYEGFDLDLNEYFDYSLDGLIRNVEVVNAEQNKEYSFVFDFKGRNLNIYKFSGKGESGLRKGKKLAYNEPLIVEDGSPSILIDEDKEPTLQFSISTGGLPPDSPNLNFQVWVRYPEPSRKVEACEGEQKPEIWHAEITAHNTENGLQTEFPATDKNGKVARITIPFRVSCKKNTGLQQFDEATTQEDPLRATEEGEEPKTETPQEEQPETPEETPEETTPETPEIIQEFYSIEGTQIIKHKFFAEDSGELVFNTQKLTNSEWKTFGIERYTEQEINDGLSSRTLFSSYQEALDSSSKGMDAYRRIKIKQITNFYYSENSIIYKNTIIGPLAQDGGVPVNVVKKENNNWVNVRDETISKDAIIAGFESGHYGEEERDITKGAQTYKKIINGQITEYYFIAPDLILKFYDFKINNDGSINAARTKTNPKDNTQEELTRVSTSKNVIIDNFTNYLGSAYFLTLDEAKANVIITQPPTQQPKPVTSSGGTSQPVK